MWFELFAVLDTASIHLDDQNINPLKWNSIIYHFFCCLLFPLFCFFLMSWFWSVLNGMFTWSETTIIHDQGCASFLRISIKTNHCTVKEESAIETDLFFSLDSPREIYIPSNSQGTSLHTCTHVFILEVKMVEILTDLSWKWGSEKSVDCFLLAESRVLTPPCIGFLSFPVDYQNNTQNSTYWKTATHYLEKSSLILSGFSADIFWNSA